MSHGIVKQVEQAYLKKDVPQFQVGDTVDVSTRIIEGEKERLQNFEGVLMSMRGEGIGESIKLRKISYGVGVERNIPIHSPRLQEIIVLKKGNARRAKLFYLRKRIGKEALKVRGEESSGAAPVTAAAKPVVAPTPAAV